MATNENGKIFNIPRISKMQIILHQSKWPRSLKQIISHAGEYAKKKEEHLFITAGRANLYNNCGS